MPNHRTDFAQFAERCSQTAKVLRWCGMPQDTEFKDRAYPHDSVALYQCRDALIEAERHARLLETIQQWARDNGDNDRLTLSAGELAAKAHIRSLLEQV